MLLPAAAYPQKTFNSTTNQTLDSSIHQFSSNIKSKSNQQLFLFCPFFKGGTGNSPEAVNSLKTKKHLVKVASLDQGTTAGHRLRRPADRFQCQKPGRLSYVTPCSRLSTKEKFCCVWNLEPTWPALTCNALSENLTWLVMRRRKVRQWWKLVAQGQQQHLCSSALGGEQKKSHYLHCVDSEENEAHCVNGCGKARNSTPHSAQVSDRKIHKKLVHGRCTLTFFSRKCTKHQALKKRDRNSLNGHVLFSCSLENKEHKKRTRPFNEFWFLVLENVLQDRNHKRSEIHCAYSVCLGERLRRFSISPVNSLDLMKIAWDVLF